MTNRTLPNSFSFHDHCHIEYVAMMPVWNGTLSSDRNIINFAWEVDGNTGMNMHFIWAKSVKECPRKNAKNHEKTKLYKKPISDNNYTSSWQRVSKHVTCRKA